MYTILKLLYFNKYLYRKTKNQLYKNLYLKLIKILEKRVKFLIKKKILLYIF